MASPVRVRLDWSLVLRKTDIPPRVITELKRLFEKPNPKFFKAQSMGFWTGNIKRTVRAWEEDETFLFLPRGAIPEVEKQLDKVGLSVELTNDTVDTEPIGFKLHGTPRPEQEAAIRDIISAGGGILRGPCGSGKTAVLLSVIARLNRRAIVVVHTGALMKQWKEAVIQWLGVSPGSIGGGGKMNLNSSVVIAMQQSLARIAKMDTLPKWTDEFSVLVGDEIHHWAAISYRAVSKLFRSRYFIGASADERRKDGLEFLIGWTFGPVVHEIQRKELEDVGRLVPIRMLVVPTAYKDDQYLESVGNDELPPWTEMISRMMDVRRAESLERAKVIWKVVQRIVADVPNARVLVLNDRVEACRMLVAQFDLMGLRAGLVIGGADNRVEQTRTIAGLQRGTLDVGVGTTVADEGLDIPALTHVVLTSPVHTHHQRMEQMVGRAARPFEGKTHATAVYIWDRMMFPAVPADDVSRDRLEEKFLDKLRVVTPDVRVMDKIDFVG